MPSPIYVSLAGSDKANGDFSLLKELAASGESARWSSLKDVQPGERVLIYCQRPHSAIVATAETAAASKVGKRWPYETAIRSVAMLERPITRAEIAKRFPEWKWAKTTRGGTRPPVKVAEWLWNRAGTNDAETDCEVVFKAGAGFGDPVNNRKVEVAAVKFATAQLEAEGYKITSRESEKVGYDLEAKKRGSVLHVEVKGVSGSLVQFPITANEVRCGGSNPTFRLFVVTGATTKSPTLHRFTWPEFVAGFARTPLSFMAKQTTKG
ncbi:DUF3883 domain-containing protein [Luteolibacter sp. GHJ8]|uniref:DUF3883 domain-containing protein n=1 Tax=Luteolibacter rhizosphaerae TaxID=2989719 RepID=A0ABT3G0L1_9BACT|nr:DUF3883 domain-containing protein [Luteolibacter rhizosphaerae]MCW1913019.1 DUF3883 domain-containing protein [Luteolibacter rhizosphaerae]